MNQLLIGSDIELMPRSIQVGQESVDWWQKWLMQASGLPPKGNRLDLGNGYWLHLDGLSVEYGFEPASDPYTFLDRIEEGRTKVAEVVGEDMIAVDWFNIATPRAALPHLADFLEMGCSPDYQVNGGDGQYEVRGIPEATRNENIRECGGHIHISLPNEYIRDRSLSGVFVRHLDDMVYPMFNMNLGDYRSWYRQRCLFRPTPYGVEYRSLGAESLFTTEVTERYVHQVFEIVESIWRNAA